MNASPAVQEGGHVNAASAGMYARGPGPTGDRPWCWQDKDVIRRIRDACDDKTYLDQTLALYLTATEKASDKQSVTFEVSKRELAAKSGVSLRRVTTILNEFRSLGVLNWITNRVPGSKELLPNTYTLMLGSACTSSGTESTRLGRDGESDNCAVIEESLEESSEKSLSTPSNRRRTHQSLTDWRDNYSAEELEAIDLYNEICTPRGWRKVNAYSEQLHQAMETFLSGPGAITDLQTLFKTAADERDAGAITYNTKLGNKMLRIFWENY
jgi:hypothetical protein